MLNPTLIKQIFNDCGRAYEDDIVGVAFRYFAAAVIQTAQPTPDMIALDLGTGTGIVARLLRPQVRACVGIDLAANLLRIGQAVDADVNLVEANAHRIPMGNTHADLVVSSFGLNATSPRLLLPEVLRVLRSGGVFAFHEWNHQHPLDSLMVDTIAPYMVDDADAPPELVTLRDYVASPHPWDNVFQTAEDYQEELSEAGFAEVTVFEDAPVTLRLSVQDFLAYKLAWSTRQRELEAMDSYARADCRDALIRNLQEHLQRDGLLHYAPILFRVRAIR